MTQHEDDDDNEEETIPSPEEILANLRSEEAALARIVNAAGPDTRRIANFLEGTVFPLLRDTLKALSVQGEAIEELEDSVYTRSTLQPGDAAKIHAFLDKSMSFYESYKGMLTVTERDEYGAMLGEVRRLTIRAEEDESPDDEDEGEGGEGDGLEGVPEIPRADQQAGDSP